MTIEWKEHREFLNGWEAWEEGECIGSTSYSPYCKIPYQGTRANGVARAFDREQDAKDWVEKPGLDGVRGILLVTEVPLIGKYHGRPPVAHEQEPGVWVPGPPPPESLENWQEDIPLLLAWDGEPYLLGCFYAEPGGGLYSLRDSLAAWLKGAPNEHLLSWAQRKGLILFIDSQGRELPWVRES